MIATVIYKCGCVFTKQFSDKFNRFNLCDKHAEWFINEYSIDVIGLKEDIERRLEVDGIR